MSSLRSITAAALTCILGFILSCAPTWAQVTTGAIAGTVTDASGAVIPDAAVTVTNGETGLTRTATASSSGEFAINLLEPGTYAVTVKASGFKSFQVANLRLDVGRTERVTALLATGLNWRDGHGKRRGWHLAADRQRRRAKFNWNAFRPGSTAQSAKLR